MSSSPPAPGAAPTMLTLISKCTVYPSRPTTLGDLKLSVSDLPMLSCHYIQKGLLFPRPPISTHPLLSLLQHSLSQALSLFPPLAGRFLTDPHTRAVYLTSNDAGVAFSHYRESPNCNAGNLLSLPLILQSYSTADVPHSVKDLFDLDGAVSYDGHSLPLAAVRVTELHDGSLFIGCTVNHAIVDGTSFWNFFNSWTALCRGDEISRSPDFHRNFFGDSTAVLRFADGAGPEVTFDAGAPLRERIFRFSREAIQELKAIANRPIRKKKLAGIDELMAVEIYGKQVHDVDSKGSENAAAAAAAAAAAEISSFQSLCAQLWRSVTRARRKLALEANTTFRMAVNCRHRVDPPVDPNYFGNAIQSIPTVALVGEVASRELRWTAGLLNRSVAAHGRERVRRVVSDWERAPRCFPLGNPDGAGVTMGSSPRFPMYDNDFGWGRPVAVRSGRANKFDGKISAFPGREGGGTVDLEVCLAPDTMAELVTDMDFMQYVSEPGHLGV